MNRLCTDVSNHWDVDCCLYTSEAAYVTIKTNQGETRKRFVLRKILSRDGAETYEASVNTLLDTITSPISRYPLVLAQPMIANHEVSKRPGTLKEKAKRKPEYHCRKKRNNTIYSLGLMMDHQNSLVRDLLMLSSQMVKGTQI